MSDDEQPTKGDDKQTPEPVDAETVLRQGMVGGRIAEAHRKRERRDRR